MILSSNEIVELYEKGKRNFNKIKSTGQDFHGFNLSGSSFRKADLSWSHLDTANLSDCDFTEANLTWSGIRMSVLRNTKFVKANVSYCDFCGSVFDKTDFSNANLTASLLFNVNLGAAKMEGANMTLTATHISQMDEAGFQFVIERLGKMGRNIPPDFLTHIKLVVVKLREKKKQLEGLKLGYGRTTTTSKNASYILQVKNLEKEVNNLYTSLNNLYTKAIGYEIKGKKDKEIYR